MKWKIKHVPKHQPATYIMQGGVFASYKWATLPLNIDISIINHIVVIGVINQILLQHVTPAKKKLISVLAGHPQHFSRFLWSTSL